jgi:hypothetical protein
MTKHFYMMLLVSGFLFARATFAQSMVVQTLDGLETSELLSSVEKFGFSGDNLVVLIKGGIADTYGVSGLSKIYFTDIPEATGITTVTAGERLAVCPNPVQDELFVCNLPEGRFLVNILRPDGTLIFQTWLSPGLSLSTGSLPAGLYFLTVDGQVLKFIRL